MHEAGYETPEELHAACKSHFLAEKVMCDGQFVAIESGSTREMCKKEFCDYTKRVDRFMNQYFLIPAHLFWED